MKTQQPARGRREHRKHLTRRELLDAGRRLFGEQGLYEARIEDLARHAGIAKGTMYGYFANKEKLMEAVVTAGFSELLGQVDRAVHEARSPREAIGLCVEAHLEFFAANPDLMRIFHQVRGMLKFKLPEGRPLRRVLSHYLASMGRSMAARMPAKVQPARSTERATILFGAVSGVSSTHAALHGSPPNPASSRRIVRALTEMLVQYDEEPRPVRSATKMVLPAPAMVARRGAPGPPTSGGVRRPRARKAG